MKKRIKTSVLTFLIVSFMASYVSFASNSIEVFGETANDNSVNLILDSLNEKELPSRFRKFSENADIKDSKDLNLTGLKSLNMSGSKQFSENGLTLMKESIDTNLPITIVDLRQESHGFVNGLPISWANSKNDANKGLTKAEVLADESNKLKSIKFNEPLAIYNHPKKTIIPTKVQNEEELVKSQSMSYVRIPVTDGKIPTDDMVDYFVQLVNSELKDNWLHFHCKQGIGRTTTFMIMYDIMKNAKEVSLDDIVKRQVALSKMSENSAKGFYNDERKSLLTNFYKYVKENNDNFNTKWSQWKKNSSTNTTFINELYDFKKLGA
ncbi:MAG: phytase [Clostridium argentinense]|uniref:fused DSP-PTPase phosphatase/NAD kinase-like protein n=1 Tax=Clostridium butanoliproducens TaxID=2991837 RepID=UPI001D4BD9CE|nr:phytase [Clostridium butanoliproducens]MBS5822847.1 phytase [Clostridium argentinense]